MAVELEKLIDPFTSTQPRQDRRAILIELTKSICPVCKINLNAQIMVEDNRMYMEKSLVGKDIFRQLLENAEIAARKSIALCQDTGLIDTVHKLSALRDVLNRAGLKPIEISIGDTPACSLMDDFFGVDEIRPGNFRVLRSYPALA